MPAAQPAITVVIPCREGTNAKTTLETLRNQTFQDFRVVVIHDQGKGANWARNQGFRKSSSEFVLFSDDDIQWERDGLETLHATLVRNPQASFAYGTYEMDRKIFCNRAYDPAILKKLNYISTMSLIRSRDFPGFDEQIKRLQDWDLWLTMLEQGKTGAFCGKLVFRTQKKDGITHGGYISWEDAEKIVKLKHKLV